MVHQALTAGGGEGTTPLYNAAFKGHLPVVQYLMEVVASLSLGETLCLTSANAYPHFGCCNRHNSPSEAGCGARGADQGAV